MGAIYSMPLIAQVSFGLVCRECEIHKANLAVSLTSVAPYLYRDDQSSGESNIKQLTVVKSNNKSRSGTASGPPG